MRSRACAAQETSVRQDVQAILVADALTPLRLPWEANREGGSSMALPPRSLVGTLAMALLLAMSSLATAQSSTVLSRDGSVVLIKKDVNGERWAITYDHDSV